MSKTYTPQEITEILKQEFGASLIVTSLGYILYGINVAQCAGYAGLFRKWDQKSTLIWVALVMIFNTASTFYQVYNDWTLSITGFTVGASKVPSEVNGNKVVLYSVVVFLVQLFWLMCLQRMMASKPKLSWLILLPIAVVSLAAFGSSIAVGALSVTEGPFEGYWPLEKTATALRVTLACAVGADVSIVIALVGQLTALKRNSVHFKGTVSRLTWIFCGSTILSTLLIIAEIIFQFPRNNGGVYTGISAITITFSPLIPPIYSFSMLSILNARTDLWSKKIDSQSQGDGHGLIPRLNFTVDLPSPLETRDIPLTTTSAQNKGAGETDSISATGEDIP